MLSLKTFLYYKQVPTRCLLLFAIEAGDLLDSVNL